MHKILSKEEIANYLAELELNSDIKQLKLKDISVAFQKLAIVLHPDKAGEGSTGAFQSLRTAYEKLRDHFSNSPEHAADSTVERDFFEDNFEAFNFPFENLGSFTVKIEDTLATVWNDCISQSLGLPLIKSNKQGTSH